MRETELNILSLVSKNIDLFMEARVKITPEMFELYKDIWSFLIKYFDEYHTLPTRDVYESLVKVDERWMARLEAVKEFSVKEVDKDSFLFFISELVDQYVGRTFLIKIEKAVQSIGSGKNIQAVRELRDSLSKLETPQDDLRKGMAFDLVKERGDKEGRVLSGILGLDNELSGWSPGELAVFVGRWSSGKTTVLLNTAYNAWLMKDVNVLFFSLEMPLREVQLKFLARHSGLSYLKIKNEQLFDYEQKVLNDKVSETKSKKGKIHIIDIPRSCTLSDIESNIASFSEPLGLVVVDYLGLIKPLRRSGSDWQDLGVITSDLRALGRFYNVPILSAHQIGRGGKDDDEDKDVRLEDLWRSYEIAHHIDVGIGLNPKKNGFELVLEVLKNRYGRRGGKHSVYLDGDKSLVSSLGVAYESKKT